MTPDEELHSIPEEHEPSASDVETSRPEPPVDGVITSSTVTQSQWHPAQDAAFTTYSSPALISGDLAAPEPPRLIPNIGHTLLFFVMAFIVLALGQVLGIAILQGTHLFGHHSFQSLFQLSNDDARLTIPVQAFSYLLVAVVLVPAFSVMWHRPFGEAVQWNLAAARKHPVALALAGFGAGIGIGLIGDLLPMPKDPPIMQDMMKSPLGAWLMLLFGVTAAPLLEELAFRGFLLPGLINTFRWLAQKGSMSETAARWIGIPISILVTSFGFALMHSPQVSHAWGPLVLIGSVSIVLCTVRLALKSVAAGVIVHSAYNLTLFAGMLAQTGGFRHLDKLTT